MVPGYWISINYFSEDKILYDRDMQRGIRPPTPRALLSFGGAGTCLNWLLLDFSNFVNIFFVPVFEKQVLETCSIFQKSGEMWMVWFFKTFCPFFEEAKTLLKRFVPLNLNKIGE